MDRKTRGIVAYLLMAFGLAWILLSGQLRRQTHEYGHLVAA